MNRIYTLLTILCCYLSLHTSAQQHNAQQLMFVPNEGQWEQPFLFKGISANADIYLEQQGITYVVGDAANAGKKHAYKEGDITEPPSLKFHAYSMKWLGANQHAKTTSSKKQSYYHNYYLGSDKSRWKGNVGVFGNVDYEEVYKNIDVHLSSEKGNLKYDFIVKPGGNAADIKIAFEGVNNIKVEKGNLILQTSVGDITEMAPYAYQYIDGVMKEVPCKYKLDGKTVYFSLPRGYDETQNLIIDPVIVFATLTGSTADNWGFTATYDHSGNFYAGGITSGPGYPTTLGAFQLTFNGGTQPPAPTGIPCDIAISKFNGAGNALIFSTYIGGSQDDMPHSLVVDGNESLILAGKSQSTNYPVSAGAYDALHNGQYDIVVTKFNAGGTALIGSTFIGGSGNDGVNIDAGYQGTNDLKFNYGDAFRSEVIVDKQNNIYVAACTRSSNFPVTANAAKNSLGGNQDGVYFKLNAGLSTLLYSTFIGGSSDDAAYVLTLDTAETHVYVSGGTKSTDFHTAVTTGAYRATYQGGLADGFICRFLNTGTFALQKATFIGTNAYDQCYGIQTDLENGVYAMGQTMGAFPVSGGVYSNPGSRQFLIKLDSLLNTATYSTVYGSGASTTPNISPVAFLVDTCQNVYISGWGGNILGSSVAGMPITNDAFQSTTDGSDFYFIVFSKNALNLLFGSYFGVAGVGEHVDGGTSRFDPQGVVYQAICAACGGATFPATSGAYSTTNGSTNCNLGALKIAFNLGSVDAVADANPNATGCAPLLVNFSNNSSNATSYFWDFNDNGATSTAATPSHTFNTPGTYNVMMVAINPNACKTHDTVMLQIVVSDEVIEANFNLQLLDTCTNPRVVLNNTSVPMPGHTLANATFQWFFGDNTTFTGQNPPVHPYPNNGTYNITLVMTDPDACNSPDTITKTVVVEQTFVSANFLIPDTICVGDSTIFTNTSVNGSQYQWDFGDGQGSSNLQNTGYRYTTAGTYTVTLVTTNPLTCNKVDSASYIITLNPQPTANFYFTPLLPETNMPTTFFNQSQNATRYQWSFGDGTGSTEENPIHQYNKSGSYTVCLTAYNDFHCAAKVCKTVVSDVLPLADVPTGFSPNGDGSNDVLYVRGFSIQTLDFKIFNRWGELVFETQNQDVGWDGTYKGKPHEMDAFAFILNITFFDGSTMSKKGNITLLR